ncbi:MAG: hypothetical protein CMJ83_22185 [Planctomycetes bacterium]|nr:hypothetical protein [Planctomycetota bacterium]
MKPILAAWAGVLLLSSLPAQDSNERRRPAADLDVHVVFMEVLSDDGLPELHTEAVWRYHAEGDTLKKTVGWGDSPGIEFNEIKRTRDDYQIRFHFSQRHASSSGGHHTDAVGGVMSANLGSPWAPARSQHGRGYRYVIFVPLDEPPATGPGRWSASEYALHLTEMLMTRRQERGTPTSQLELMSRMPLMSLLPAPELVAFREYLRTTPSPRRSRRRSQPFDHLVSRRDLALAVRLAAGDDEAIRHVLDNGFERPLLPAVQLAFFQIPGPELRGEIGWALIDPESPARRPELIVPYWEQLRAGKVVLPGNPDQVESRTQLLIDLVAEKDVTGAVVVLICGVLAMLGVALAARRLSGRLAW